MYDRTVLFVDDEPKMLSSIERTLCREPYNIITTEGARKALSILDQKQVHVLVTDLRMPGISGFELIQLVKNEYPHIIRMILTGYTDIETLLTAINKGQIFRYIIKPWKNEGEFKLIIRQAIEFFDLHIERQMMMTTFEQIIEGEKPENINYELIQKLINRRKEHLYEWNQMCKLIPQEIL